MKGGKRGFLKDKRPRTGLLSGSTRVLELELVSPNGDGLDIRAPGVAIGVVVDGLKRQLTSPLSTKWQVNKG